MKYRVFMKVHATAVVEVDADSADDALEVASEEYCETAIPICHQCSDDISDPTYGEPVEAVAIGDKE